MNPIEKKEKSKKKSIYTRVHLPETNQKAKPKKKNIENSKKMIKRKNGKENMAEFLI